MPGRTAIVWFRHDLRLRDNPALRDAVDRFDTVQPVYIWSPESTCCTAPGRASRVWLHQSLEELCRRIERAGASLILQQGDPREILPKLARALRASAVHWNRRYVPALMQLDQEVRALLTDDGIDVKTFKANLLHEPWEVSTNDDRPYRVFTPFWKRASGAPDHDEPRPEVRKIPPAAHAISGVTLDQFALLPRVPWDTGIRGAWSPGELGARKRLREFMSGPIQSYHHDRDYPAVDGSSRLSPHLHFGEIGPRQIVHAIRCAGLEGPGPEAFVRELGWREFAHHVLHHFPHTVDEPLQPGFSAFRWRNHPKHLRAWQRGRTGYPIVDAGMRELWHTGWMHNRVRMIVASFLVKDLLVDWRKGAEWFLDTLVDADLANNTLGWQWAAGCGADAAPWFRIFNPVRQGERFDPAGDYVRRWVPELARLPARWIHNPWDAPERILRDAGVSLGETYPKPIVDHAEARAEALKRFRAL